MGSPDASCLQYNRAGVGGISEGIRADGVSGAVPQPDRSSILRTEVRLGGAVTRREAEARRDLWRATRVAPTPSSCGTRQYNSLCNRTPDSADRYGHPQRSGRPPGSLCGDVCHDLKSEADTRRTRPAQHQGNRSATWSAPGRDAPRPGPGPARPQSSRGTGTHGPSLAATGQPGDLLRRRAPAGRRPPHRAGSSAGTRAAGSTGAPGTCPPSVHPLRGPEKSGRDSGCLRPWLLLPVVRRRDGTVDVAGRNPGSGRAGGDHAAARTVTVFDDSRIHVELLAARATVTAPGELDIYLRAFARMAELAVYGADARALIVKAIDALH